MVWGEQLEDYNQYLVCKTAKTVTYSISDTIKLELKTSFVKSMFYSFWFNKF